MTEEQAVSQTDDQAEDQAAAAAPTLLTLEELTARVGLTVRTVRFYTSRGLVPPPVRQGRSGFYGEDHVARFELVQELQAHGFTLAAIEGYLRDIPEDASAADIMLRSTMLAPWHSDRPVSMTRSEIEARADRPLKDDDLEVLVALGVVAPGEEPDRYDVAVAQLSVGLGLVGLGFPAQAAVAASEVYRRHGQEIAHELYDVFRRLAWPAFREAGTSPVAMQDVVERLKPLSIASLVAAYEIGMDETKRENIAHRTR